MKISVDPDTPYNKLKPNSINPDANDPNITYFKDASFDFLSFFNIPANIYDGILTNSKDKYIIIKLTEDVIKNIPKRTTNNNVLYSILYSSSNSFEYLDTKTNCTVLQEPQSEADDLIARWIHNHPDNEHVIVSSDSDFHQLINDKVSMYNGIANQHVTINGIYDDNGKIVMDKKTNTPKVIPDPEYILFEKCVRGDASDNVFSAYPGARKKGSRNKTGIKEAYEDRDNQGFAWNNFMLQRWTDHNGEEHIVRDDFERNVQLIDLTAQPMDLKVKFVETIAENSIPKSKTGVGMNFLKFCGIHDLQNLAKSPDEIASILNNPYPAE